MDKLWGQYKRIIKDNGAIVLTAMQPFASTLVMGNKEQFKYEWIWKKDGGTGWLNAKKQPMRIHEQVLIFALGQTKYYPIKRPMGNKILKDHGAKSSNYGKQYPFKNQVNLNKDRCPVDLITFKRDKEKLHPTQKPVALFEYLISTYTDEKDLVLDNCIGSGTTAIACLRLNRDFIGIEKDLKYLEIANKRIQNEISLNV